MYLLDINVLIALFSPLHVHHEKAQKWFGRQSHFGWASCTLTEIGVLRILSNPASGSAYDRPAQVAVHLQEMKKCYPDHRFLEDSPEILSGQIINLERVVSWKHLTDAYLLGLAYANGAKLATLDQGISQQWLQDKQADALEVL